MSDVRITATNSISAVDNWLKALAGNLTGSTVTGFRQTRVQFEDVLSNTLQAGARGDGNVGSIDPIQYSYGGTAIKATRTDFSQGALNSTQRPTDLAISGDGFFVLSKVKNPKSTADLVYTRDGSFNFQLEPGGILSGPDQQKLTGAAQFGTLYLTSQEGYYVMGVTGSYDPSGVAGVPGTPNPPNEGSINGTSISGLQSEAGRKVGDPLGGLSFKPFKYPFIKDTVPDSPFNLNADLLGRVRFDKNGMLVNTGVQDVPDSADSFEKGDGLVHLQAPDAANNGVAGRDKFNKYVGVASFASPDGLQRQAGTQFTWAPTAGSMFLGVAGVEDAAGGVGHEGRTVGASNEISAGSLETSNSSVNTALPELTIAQKSFTANVKIVSVGNTLIDDVNQLIR